MSDKGEPTGVDPKATDAEAADGKINSAAEIEAIKESAGWKFPKVKLAAWDPEDETQWEAVGQGIAKRNLLSSIPNLTCGFGVWLVWSGELLIIYAVLWFILDNVLSPRNPIS